MKYYILQFQGLRGSVMHYYFETSSGSVLFAAGADMLYQFNCILSSKRKLRKELGKCQKHEIREINNSKLEAMIDLWCVTDNRWQADSLKKKLEAPVMYIVQEKEKRNLEAKVWKELHAFGKNPALGSKALEKAMRKAKAKLSEGEFAELTKRAEHMLAQYHKKQETAQ
jgi:hypothetical protein